jgi:hypothetical protein
VRPAAIAIVAAAIALSQNTLATTCPAPEGASPVLTSVEGEQRLTYLEGALSRAGEQSTKWGGVWRATFQTAAAVQFSLALVAKKEADRIDLTANGIKASTGFLFALVFRLPAERHDTPWGDRPWTDGPLCARVASAEAALANDAKFEKRGRSIGMQALGIGFNLAVGITQFVLHRRLWSVALTTISGAVVGEARVFTQPTVATESYEAYLAGKLETTKVSIIPTIVPVPGGAEMGVALTF